MNLLHNTPKPVDPRSLGDRLVHDAPQNGETVLRQNAADTNQTKNTQQCSFAMWKRYVDGCLENPRHHKLRAGH
jgi:hypothetical protein